MIKYKLEEEFIPLNKLLKVLRLAQTGGHAKILISEGEVRVNDEVEYRLRRKIRIGDVILIQDKTIFVD